MSEQKMIVGKCPKCGEELQIPAHLEQFSCMYCGQKLSMSEATAPNRPLEGDAGQLIASVVNRIPACVLNYRDSRNRISKNTYFSYFEDMESFSVPVLADLNLACALEPRRKAEFLQMAATALLDGLEADWANSRKKRVLQDDDKMTLAIFFVPMIGKQKLPISKDFMEIIHDLWMKRYPKNVFLVGDYDDISAGFKKKFRLCFITTAVCESRGLADDCAQLTAFRQFRDGYLMAQPEGESLIAEYYEIAPAIVTCIDHCADRTDRYEAIGRDYLDPCYAQLQAGKLADCQKTYTEMVQSLRKTYLH